MFAPDARCRICNLPEDMIKSIHFMRLVEGKSLPMICKALEEISKSRGLRVDKFYPTNLNKHFKRHMDPALTSVYMSQLGVGEPGSALTTRVTSITQAKQRDIQDHLISVIAPENLEMFDRLQEVVDRLTTHMDVLEEVLPNKNNVKSFLGDPNASFKDTYAPYLGLVKELRNTITELSKFLNLKGALRRFVEELLREYTHKVTAAFLEEARRLQVELVPDDPIASSLIREVSTSFATKLANATDAIIDKFENILRSVDSNR